MWKCKIEKKLKKNWKKILLRSNIAKKKSASSRFPNRQNCNASLTLIVLFSNPSKFNPNEKSNFKSIYVRLCLFVQCSKLENITSPIRNTWPLMTQVTLLHLSLWVTLKVTAHVFLYVFRCKVSICQLEKFIWQFWLLFWDLQKWGYHL